MSSRPTPPASRRSRLCLVLMVSFASSLASLRAQQAATPPPTAKDEPIRLQPFEVDASNDSRYRAASTLAGSRLNSSLKDVASVIDVYTKDFMDDIGATTLEQVLAYANNLERDTEDTIHGLANLNISTSNSFRYRIRGLPASRARGYFEFDFPIDTYISDRLDESRGPNAILFGFGSPGGIVNSSTKQPLLQRDLAQLEVKTGTEIDHRASLDVSQRVLDRRLALRFNAVNQRLTGWRAYTYEDIDAYHFAVKAAPFKKTLINLEYERFHQDDSVARPLTYWSQTDTWDAAGRPLINTNFANRANATLNPGFNVATIAQVSANNFWVYNEQSGQVLNWRGMSRSNRATYTNPAGRTFTAFADMRAQILQPDGIVEVNTMGPGTGRDLAMETFFATLQQEITPALHFEAALSRYYADWGARRLPATTMFADPNAFLPAGGAASTGPAATNPAPNPFRGQYYVETAAQFWRTTTDTLNYRASFSFDHDFKNWLGRHRVAGLFERNDYGTRTRSLQEQVLVNGTLASTLPANAANNFNRRYYVNPANPRSVRNANITLPPVPLDITLADGTRLQTRLFEMRSAPADYTKYDDIWMGVLQGRWWKDRFHTTVGIRRDDAVFDDWGSYVADNAGAYVRSAANRSDVPYTGNTRNYGIVFHATDWASVFANFSNSLGVPGLKIIYAPTGAFMDPTTGEGRDFGIKFRVPRLRLEGSLSYYEATSDNDTDSQNVEGWGVNGHNNFLTSLVAANLMTAAQANPLRATGTGDTVDSESKGVEFSLVGAISANWDVRLNYSYTERSLSNAFPRVNAWAEKTLRPFWATWNRDNPSTPAADNILDTVFSGAQSLRDIIDTFESNLATRTLVRTRVTGLRPHKANLYTTYALKEGTLKGVRLGGGIRYEAANFAGQDASGKNYRGLAFTNVDLMAAYTRKIWGRTCTFQVNVRNALHGDAKVSPSVVNASGNWDSIVLQVPRQIDFTLRVAF